MVGIKTGPLTVGPTMAAPMALRLLVKMIGLFH